MIWYKYIQIYMFWSLWIKDDWEKKILISEKKVPFLLEKRPSMVLVLGNLEPSLCQLYKLSLTRYCKDLSEDLKINLSEDLKIRFCNWM